MNPQRLELAILNAVARATTDGWLACSIGSLRNRMGEIDGDAASESTNSISDAIVSLAQENNLSVGKKEGGGKRMPFDQQKRIDEGYLSSFFGREFNLKLTHEGRRRIAETDGTAAEQPPGRTPPKRSAEEAGRSPGEALIFQTAFNTYRVTERNLGRGGAGTVHVVEDIDGGQFALKISTLRPEPLEPSASRMRLPSVPRTTTKI